MDICNLYDVDLSVRASTYSSSTLRGQSGRICIWETPLWSHRAAVCKTVSQFIVCCSICILAANVQSRSWYTQWSARACSAELSGHAAARAPSQYPKRRPFVRSRIVSKPRDWYFKLSYRFEIWQAHRQQCYRSACQISERSDNSKYTSRGFETLRDLTERRLFG